jgi:PIN domain nuclease of toxin-antitoxin system
MKLLLDTHILLRTAGQPQKLSKVAKQLLEDPANELLFSPASIWEIATKQGTDRSDFKVEPRVLRRGLLDNGYVELSITSEHTAATDTLPSLHSDPFDRILIAQSMVEGITLVTTDQLVAQYPGPIQKV